MTSSSSSLLRNTTAALSRVRRALSLNRIRFGGAGGRNVYFTDDEFGQLNQLITTDEDDGEEAGWPQHPDDDDGEYDGR